jgi:hypothetical protein
VEAAGKVFKGQDATSKAKLAAALILAAQPDGPEGRHTMRGTHLGAALAAQGLSLKQHLLKGPGAACFAGVQQCSSRMRS